MLKDINILAFVSDTNGKDIMNVTSVKPAYKNHGQAVSATITTPQLGVSEKYGFNFIEVEINNTSLETITSAEFEVEINGVSQTATWEGSVAPLTTEMAKVSYPKESLQESNQWSVTLTKVNSQEVAPSVITGTFAQPSEASAEIKVTIETDKNIVEHVWRILDEDGNVHFSTETTEKKYSELKEKPSTNPASKNDNMIITEEIPQKTIKKEKHNDKKQNHHPYSDPSLNSNDAQLLLRRRCTQA